MPSSAWWPDAWRQRLSDSSMRPVPGQATLPRHGRGLGMRRIRHIHFVGIGGAGMCGIAEVFAKQGYVNSGSELKASAGVSRLREHGIGVAIGHADEHVEGAGGVGGSRAAGAGKREI